MPSPIVPTEELEVFAHGLDHSEGICLSPDGHLYVGGEAGQLYRIEDDGTPQELLSTGGFMLGLAADAHGNIYACDNGHAVVWKIDPTTGARDVFTAGAENAPLRVPNWGCFDRDGNYYVSDSGGWLESNGRIYVVRPDGTSELWTDQTADFPNGMTVAADESCLYVLESVPAKLVRVPIEADGSAGRREVLLEMPGTVPDGVALTTTGAFVIACYRPDMVYLWQPGDELKELAGDPLGTAIAAPTNVVFAGDDLSTMIVPNLGRWHLTRFRAEGVIGVPLFYPAL